MQDREAWLSGPRLTSAPFFLKRQHGGSSAWKIRACTNGCMDFAPENITIEPSQSILHLALQQLLYSMQFMHLVIAPQHEAVRSTTPVIQSLICRENLKHDCYDRHLHGDIVARCLEVEPCTPPPYPGRDGGPIFAPHLKVYICVDVTKPPTASARCLPKE